MHIYILFIIELILLLLDKKLCALYNNIFN